MNFDLIFSLDYSHIQCNDDGYAPDPRDCTKFYRCASGRVYQYDCPETTVFDRERDLCMPMDATTRANHCDSSYNEIDSNYDQNDENSNNEYSSSSSSTSTTESTPPSSDSSDDKCEHGEL